MTDSLDHATHYQAHPGSGTDTISAAKPLTVGEVLKQCNDAIALSGYFSLYWDRESGNWIVHQAGNARVPGGIRFASPDESAACAEFLRLTGGLSK